MSLYAATKRADELMSHAYAHLFGIPQTGLRFFTVYGPWGRPDMAYFSFAQAIVAGEPITLYDEGRLKRDFTYIDDIVAGVVGCLDHPPEDAGAPARVLNIGNHRARRCVHLVRLLEQALGRKAIIRSAPRPAVDVEETFASIEAIAALTGFAPVHRWRSEFRGLLRGSRLEWRAGEMAGPRRKRKSRLTVRWDRPKSPSAAMNETLAFIRSSRLPSSVCAGVGAQQSKAGCRPTVSGRRSRFCLCSLKIA